MSANTETWFEVRIDRDLAIMFQRIVNVHARIGRARRADLLTRLESALRDEAGRKSATACPECGCDPLDPSTLGTHEAAACINPRCPAGCSEDED